MTNLCFDHLEFTGESMSVTFNSGDVVAVPITRFPRLHAASPAEREQWELIGGGMGVHWEALDEDLSVENILIAHSRAKAAEPGRGTGS